MASKTCTSKSEALKLEQAIKASPREKKLSFFQSDEFICKRCGRCCSGKGGFSFHGNVTAAEYAEIAKTAPRHVLKWFVKLPHTASYDYFISPRAGNEPERCPWLKVNGDLFFCVIHHCKPPACKAFPLDTSQILTALCGCRGLEHLDKP
jgi:Fe-S-cluster containining protein